MNISLTAYQIGPDMRVPRECIQRLDLGISRQYVVHTLVHTHVPFGGGDKGFYGFYFATVLSLHIHQIFLAALVLTPAPQKYTLIPF